uniref:Fdx1 n=1 Tax=Arundo donax TaxID=35708 RepID=A0A0A9EM80_ARUDO
MNSTISNQNIEIRYIVAYNTSINQEVSSSSLCVSMTRSEVG